MYVITVLSHFAGAHCLRHLRGKCEALHGHNWKIEVAVASTQLGKEGIVIDFGILKKKVEKILKTLDHKFLNELSFFSSREPSSENIAFYIFSQMEKDLKRYPVTVRSVTAWESETACATYFAKTDA
jgi:6-pyruvoyltetrahydropterin/6-carboxytetrahydropterin synthase